MYACCRQCASTRGESFEIIARRPFRPEQARGAEETDSQVAAEELEQISDVFGIARLTVVRDRRMTCAWLQRELSK